VQLFNSIPAALLLLLVSCARSYSQCPVVSIEGTGAIPSGEVLKLSAKLSPESDKQPEFKWEISAGRITSNPKASTILVDTAGLGDQLIITTVKVIGIQTNCSMEASFLTKIYRVIVENMAFDEYGDIKFIDEKPRLDNFAIQVQNEPGSRGYLIVYAGQRTYPHEAAERLNRAKNYLVRVRHIPPERIITVDGGHRRELLVILWVVPVGVSLPSGDPYGLLTPDKLDFSKPRPKVTTRRRNHRT